MDLTKKNPYPPNSRYYGLEVASLGSDENTVNYLRRRFIPPPSDYGLLQYHLVTDADRLDLIAATNLGDPEMFWLLCDANGAVDPDELTDEPGRVLRITLPAGIPGQGEEDG